MGANNKSSSCEPSSSPPLPFCSWCYGIFLMEHSSPNTLAAAATPPPPTTATTTTTSTAAAAALAPPLRLLATGPFSWSMQNKPWAQHAAAYLTARKKYIATRYWSWIQRSFRLVGRTNLGYGWFHDFFPHTTRQQCTQHTEWKR